MARVGTAGPALPSERLAAHLARWLGGWPPSGALDVVESPVRATPGWDGRVHDAVGVATPAGGVLSVRPGLAGAVQERARSWRELPGVLAAALGRPGAPVWLGTLRWTQAPADLPEVGTWRPAGDPGLPEWLRPFGGEVLVALDQGRYAAGVGLKRHDAFGIELAVGTDPAHRGRGLAVRLVAQAARAILAAGAVPTYIHDPANVASARTAAAAGFPDEGWQALGMPPAAG
jgi:GNAT superfamily N-acetyltransferase